ncbi:MAG TPA: NAD(P)-binding protein [Elusimicrobiota bacterium]|nr:NAD(P)-binding protein [Elusimicrobiota bacterium]
MQLRPRPDVLRRTPYVVVGAGAQGLTFALSLARKGLPVLLFERSSVVGGQARSFHYGRFTFDFGLHAFVTKSSRVADFVRGILGSDFTSFYPRAASHWGRNGLIEDSSFWRFQNAHKRLYALLPKSGEREWSCMRISKPPKIIYPRRGGFGSLFERMGKELIKCGGEMALGAGVEARDFIFNRRRLTHIKVGGTKFPVRGCYWSAGRPFALNPGSQKDAPPARPRDALLLHHFIARGRAPLPYHWVRLPESGGVLLPPLAYYPARFSPQNAPRGHYSVGTTTPILSALNNKRLGPLSEWASSNPQIFLKSTLNYIVRLGLIRPKDVVGSFSETVVLPHAVSHAARLSPARRFENFWHAPDFAVHSPEESGVSMQIESAFKALGVRGSPSVRPPWT